MAYQQHSQFTQSSQTSRHRPSFDNSTAQGQHQQHRSYGHQSASSKEQTQQQYQQQQQQYGQPTTNAFNMTGFADALPDYTSQQGAGYAGGQYEQQMSNVRYPPQSPHATYLPYQQAFMSPDMTQVQYTGSYGHVGQGHASMRGHAGMQQPFMGYSHVMTSPITQHGFGHGGYGQYQQHGSGYGRGMSGMPPYQHERRRSSLINTIPNPNSIPPSLRGPPQKPQQTGHALWVGNLPNPTSILDLKDHFSQGAMNDIISVFLISRSNCAFANYRTAQSCEAAVNRFHDSRFGGVRLVCRLRRVTEGQQQDDNTQMGGFNRGYAGTSTEQGLVDGVAEGQPARRPDLKERFFVVKSLTIEDLEQSVRSGVWATQAHNVEALDLAYQDSEAVYLIFSANKSGEYYGYAKMTSRIDDETAKTLVWKPRAAISLEEQVLPRAIITPPTKYAPAGRILDDSARGTIFWEATSQKPDEKVKVEDGKNGDDAAADTKPAVTATSSGTTEAFGKPFKVEWISTNRLAFHRLRGMRNEWNSNREVKIARDGTEIETELGRRLLAMFDHPM